MAKIERELVAHIRSALQEYIVEVEESLLAPNTKATYIRHASTLVRWLYDDFSPGATLARQIQTYLEIQKFHESGE